MNKHPSLDDRVLEALGSNCFGVGFLRTKVRIGSLRLLQHLTEMTQRGLLIEVKSVGPQRWKRRSP